MKEFNPDDKRRVATIISELYLRSQIEAQIALRLFENGELEMAEVVIERSDLHLTIANGLHGELPIENS